MKWKVTDRLRWLTSPRLTFDTFRNDECLPLKGHTSASCHASPPWPTHPPGVTFFDIPAIHASFEFSHSQGQPQPFAPGFFVLESWSVVTAIPAEPKVDRRHGALCHEET